MVINPFTLFFQHWHRGLFVVLALVVAIALPGCSLDRFKIAEAQIPRLVYAVLSDPQTFNAALNNESPNIFTLTYEGLVTVNGITSEVEPALAEKWEISDDNKRITFTVRQGLQWSDGEPLTVDDVVFTYNQVYFNPAIPSSEKDVLRIGREGKFPQVRKVGDRQVEFLVPEPFAPFLRSAGLSILPKHALIEAVEQTDAEGNPLFLSTWGIDTPPAEIIVNGPYKLETYEPSQRVIFRRNPYYWRQDTKGNPQPYIERIVWQIVENTDTSLLQFRSGGLDLVGVTPEYFSLLKNEEERSNFTIEVGGPAPGITYISFNLNRGTKKDGKPLIEPYKSRWFNTVAFRQAVAYAINREQIVNNIYRGLGEPQTSQISVQSPYYLSPEEDPTLPTYPYNPEKSKQLLLRAGFRYGDRGELFDSENNRVRFTLITNAGNKIREAMGSQIKEDLGKIGIQVDFQPIAFQTMVEKLDTTRDWDCHLIGFGGGVEPHFASNLWSTQGRLHMFNLGPQSEEDNIANWKVADWEQKINDLYIQASQELDEAKRKEIYAQTQRLAQEYLPLIYLVNPLSMAAIRDRIEGIQYSSVLGPLWNVHELKLTE
ncbi:ABC transporter substrate-binding protein [bacterium]|nr:ABC transporter substrate-binding protein [bacterium]